MASETVDAARMSIARGAIRRPVAVWLAILFCLLLFGLAMGFLFTARAVTVSVTPAPEHLEVSGGLVLRWGERAVVALAPPWTTGAESGSDGKRPNA